MLGNNIHLSCGIERIMEALKKPYKTVPYGGTQKAYIQIADTEILQLPALSTEVFLNAKSAPKWEEDEP